MVAIRRGFGLLSSLIMFLTNRTASAPLRVGVALIGLAILVSLSSLINLISVIYQIIVPIKNVCLKLG